MALTIPEIKHLIARITKCPYITNKAQALERLHAKLTKLERGAL